MILAVLPKESNAAGNASAAVFAGGRDDRTFVVWPKILYETEAAEQAHFEL